MYWHDYRKIGVKFRTGGVAGKVHKNSHWRGHEGPRRACFRAHLDEIELENLIFRSLRLIVRD